MPEEIPAGLHLRDAQQAFKDAIANGEFPDTVERDGYIYDASPDNWMYMHSEGIQDVFKHVGARTYFTTSYTSA